ncbi:unnamed protein product [Didymodactylos carnosus]|uniref:Nuclear receptor domain-containing protein n=1 Tax=Didymodactylos carnosus TaxID=1234261 RepID=A0A813ZYJ9_9BILA|nr:unnamed protein product [Didymodactylos carnosus]CAF1054405.1 unnamed protein product [Didymodactylos carnosus]CAF3686938.1 unnamed protein product [Didymodactylos carnosus]CAF3820800.1 unnamed protein product [Didymodactylos carnosus]
MSMSNVGPNSMYHLDYNNSQGFGISASPNTWLREHDSLYTSYNVSVDDAWTSLHSNCLSLPHQNYTTYTKQQQPQQQHCLSSIPHQSTTMIDGSDFILPINNNSYQDNYSPLYQNQILPCHTLISPTSLAIPQESLNALDSTSYNSTLNISSTAPCKSLFKIQSADGKQVCQVCGDESSGYHFGAFTCESCKVFYRRVLHGIHDIKHSCDSPQDINKSNRKGCRACRFEKCSRVGMSTTNKRLTRRIKQTSDNFTITTMMNTGNFHQLDKNETNDSQLYKTNCSHIIRLFNWLGNCLKNGQQPQQQTCNYYDYSLLDVIENVLKTLDINETRICTDVQLYDLYKLCEYHIRQIASTNFLYNFLTSDHSFTVILFLLITLFNTDIETSSSSLVMIKTAKIDKLLKVLHYEIGMKCMDKRRFNIVKALFMKCYVEISIRIGELTQYSNNNSINVGYNNRILS